MIDSGINVSGLLVYLKSTTTYLKSIQVELTKKVDGFSSAILTRYPQNVFTTPCNACFPPLIEIVTNAIHVFTKGFINGVAQSGTGDSAISSAAILKL